MNDKLEKLYDKLEEIIELRRWKKLIIRACKKNSITDYFSKEMYKNIQKDVILSVRPNTPTKELDKKTIPRYSYFPTVIKQRIYDLNREFIFLINGEFHNSIYSLTRQMGEICIILIKCREDKNTIQKILQNKKLDLKIGNIINELKGKIRFPYLKDFEEDKFLIYLHETFKEFSDLIHISGTSLSQNMWVITKDSPVMRPYIQDPNLKEGELLLTFSKKSMVSSQRYKDLIHQFYTFSGLCLSELNLIE